MRAEQVSTERVSPVSGREPESGGFQAWRGRLEESAALLAPVALILGLTLSGGGYEVSERHWAGLLAWLLVVALILLGVASQARLAKPFYWATGLILAVSLLSAISSFWSGSVELSVIEGDRALAYLGFFLAAFLIAQTEKRAQRFGEGLAIAVGLVALLALASRLLPDLVEVGDSFLTTSRLAYPLGYWNADGAIFGIAAGLLLWMSRGASWAWLRAASVTALPAVLLALYFTYSRGGLLTLAIAVGLTIALSRDRLWLLGTLAIGSLGALPAVLAVQDRRDVADNLGNQAAADQGLAVLLILLAGAAATLALFAGMRGLERRRGGRTSRAVELSRSPKLLASIAGLLAVVAVTVAVAFGGDAWDRFSSSDVQFPDTPEQHFSDFSSAGRHDFYRVALDTLGDHPLLGSGAGTYQFEWAQRRSIDLALHNAHSLYLESFAELGLVGGLLVLATMATLLWIGFGAWRDARGAQRARNGALLAAAVAFAIAAGFDWFWELAGVGAVFFLAAGALVAARCARIAGPSRDDEEGQRFGVAVAGLALAWIAAVALIGPLLVDRELKASQGDAARGDLTGAVNHANTARSIEPFAASPYTQLGLLAESQGDYATADERLTQAIDREDRNWQLYYLRSRVNREAGDQAAARADLERARRLNPLEPCLQGRPSCG